jgi:hypothetical protein
MPTNLAATSLWSNLGDPTIGDSSAAFSHTGLCDVPPKVSIGDSCQLPFVFTFSDV